MAEGIQSGVRGDEREGEPSCRGLIVLPRTAPAPASVSQSAAPAAEPEAARLRRDLDYSNPTKILILKK